jgi:alkylated DNA repair dioxygenase AlkB
MSPHESQSHQNLLPYDGVARYFGAVMDTAAADDYFMKLFNTIFWKNDTVTIYGKQYVTKRKAAWHGDQPFEYTYSHATKKALAWTPELLELKTIAQKSTGKTFNSCLLNLYHDGTEGMSWHSDNEKELEKNAAICSMSFGAERKFSFKHRTTKETISIILEHGSLLLMDGETQTHWLHALPKSTKIKSPRVNLTFRTFKI